MKDEAERMKPIYQEAKKNLEIDREKLESAKYDFSIIRMVTGTVALIGILLGWYGFWNWRAIQLKQDRLLDLEVSEKIQSHASTSR